MDNLTVVPIATPAQESFEGICLTLTEAGHVRSPWFSFVGANALDHSHLSTQRDLQQMFLRVRDASVSAFATATSQSSHDVMCAERRNPIDGATEWILVTRFPCGLPKPKPQSSSALPFMPNEKSSKRIRPTVALIGTKDATIENLRGQVRRLADELATARAELKAEQTNSDSLRAGGIKIEDAGELLADHLEAILGISRILRWILGSVNVTSFRNAITSFHRTVTSVNLKQRVMGFTGCSEFDIVERGTPFDEKTPSQAQSVIDPPGSL